LAIIALSAIHCSSGASANPIFHLDGLAGISGDE
jgi:hypothetical protein